jgi:apolipoprotein N-acyltransferase
MIPAPAAAVKNIKNVAGSMSHKKHHETSGGAKRSKSYLLRLSPRLLAAFSGALLALCYPTLGWGFLAWLALIPLLAALVRAHDLSQALGYGLITGVAFFCFSMHWLTHVSTLGWIILVLMESVYIMAFAWLVFRGMKSQRSIGFKIVWIALAWTVSEVLRAEMPIFGFGWNLLAYSQSSYVLLIQFANILGAYGLGFLIVLVNASLFYVGTHLKERRTVLGLVAIVILVWGGLLVYGKTVFARSFEPQEYLRVSVLQGNIPQSVKWAVMAKEKILDIYERLTQFASLDQPDLIIWPEASFPGYFNRDLQAEQISRLAQEVQTPLLVGGLRWMSEQEVYNSAYLLEKDGSFQGYYDKLRLVPFGEYIPLKFLLGWLTPIADALGVGDFSAGKDSVVFRWAREEWPFGVLICFEDVFTDLARYLADRDAKFLAVITNDAWFGHTGAPFQHLQASIFRAVENGVAVVRAANTGVSAFISFRGEVLGTVKNVKGEETFILGQSTLDLPLITRDTFYRQGGWMFPYAAVGLFLIMSIGIVREKKHA